MAIKTFDANETQRYLYFSQRYGMLMYVDKRDVVAQIERDWAQKGIYNENNLVFSSELQLKMAGELKLRGIEPIRSVEGTFEKIINSTVTYGPHQAPTEQVKLTLSDEGVNYVIALDKNQDIAAQLVCSVAENMEVGFIYDVSLYLKKDSNGYKDSRVIVRDSFGTILRSTANNYFHRYTEYMKKAKAMGIQFAEQQELRIGTKASNQVIGQTMDRYRAKFVTQLIDRFNEQNHNKALAEVLHHPQDTRYTQQYYAD